MAKAGAEDGDGGLPEYCTAGVLVLGCGNPFMGDDGFGPAVAELLLHEREAGSGKREGAAVPPPFPLPAARSLCVINAGTGSRGMIFNMVTGTQRPKAIIIVDALRAGRRPGELFWVDIEDLSLEKAEDFSLHMTPASNMLLELKKMGVEIRVLACEPKNLPDVMTGGLSAEVAAAVGPAAEKVLLAADEILKSA
jgi:coenzyme F420 hydrogenase subunit delta